MARLWPHPPDRSTDVSVENKPGLNLRKTNGGRHICWYLKKKKKEREKETKCIHVKFQNKGSLFIYEFTVVHAAFFWYLLQDWYRDSGMSGCCYCLPPVFCRIISEPHLCLLEAWIQKLERESRLRLQGNNLMVCMEEEKHRVRSKLSSLEVHGIHISNLLSPNLLVLNPRQTWLLLSSQHIWEEGTSLVLSGSPLQPPSPTQRFPWHLSALYFFLNIKSFFYLFGCLES